MSFTLSGGPLKILDFDVEARPLSWYGGDWVTKEITAVAWKWIGTKTKPACCLLGELPGKNLREDTESMLWNFVQAYDMADMVTGHYIRGYDLPVLNAMCIEVGLPPLGEKLSHDTKLDLVRMSGISKSQENLASMLGLKHPKVSMDQTKWREANRLTEMGIGLTKERVVGDVVQHIELRQKLMDLGMLGRPKLWTPHASGKGKYAP